MNYVTVDQLYAFTTLIFFIAATAAGGTVGVAKIVLYILQHNDKKK